MTSASAKRKHDWPPIGVQTLETVKRAYIAHVLRMVDGNVSHAAKLLQVQRSTVRNNLP